MVFERIEAAGVKEVKVGGQSRRSKLKVVCLAAEGFVDDNSSTSSIFSTAKALTLYSFQVFSSTSNCKVSIKTLRQFYRRLT